MSLQKQVLWSTVGNFVLLFGQWLISIVLTRLSGFAEAGIFTLAMTMANVFAYVGYYSTRHYLTSDDKGEFTHAQYIQTRILTILASYVLCVFFVLFYGYDLKNTLAILLYLLYANEMAFSDVLHGCMQVKSHLEVAGISSTIKGIACFAVFFAVHVLTGELLLSLAAMSVTAYGVLLFYELGKFKEYVGNPLKDAVWESKKIMRLLKVCFPLMLSVVLPNIITALPRMEVERQQGEALLGVYGSIFMPTVIITTLVPSLVTALVPTFTEDWNQMKKSEFIKHVVMLVGATVVFGALACLATFIMGIPVMSFVFGKEIIPYVPLLYYAIIATVFSALASCGTVLLTVVRKLRFGLFTTVSCLIIVGATAPWLVSNYSLHGASCSLMLGYSVQVLLQYGLLVYMICTQGKNKK